MKRLIIALALLVALFGFGAAVQTTAPVSVAPQEAHAACSMAAYSPYSQVSGTLRGQFRISGCGTVYVQVCVQRLTDYATLGCRTQYTNSTLWWYESYNAGTCYGRTWAWANGYGTYISQPATCS